MEEKEIISDCLTCKHFTGKAKYAAKRNGTGIPTVRVEAENQCLKYDYDPYMIDKDGTMVPDVVGCSGKEEISTKTSAL